VRLSNVALHKRKETITKNKGMGIIFVAKMGGCRYPELQLAAKEESS